MPNCAQCGRVAFVQVGGIPLCIDCHLKHQQAIDLINDRLERQLNYITEQMEATVGLPGILPRVKTRQPVIQQGDFTLNNIHVDKSVVGTINTGNVQSIDIGMNNIKLSGNSKLAQELSKFTEEVIKERGLSKELKDSLLEQVAFLVQECQASKEKQKKSIIKSVLSNIKDSVVTIETLYKLWDGIRPLLERMF